MTTLNIRAATMAQLVAFFNANTGGNPVKKFADRPTAEKRVQRLVDEMAAESMVEEMGIQNAKQAAHIIAEKISAGANSTTTADLIVKTNQPEIQEFIPSYNHRVCPKCGSSEIYNGRTDGGLVVEEDKIAGCHACDWVQDDRKMAKTSVAKPPTSTGKARPVMQTSLKLDRRIRNLKTGETWKNAYQMWIANPAWMTSAQQDRLTSQLYAAAKKGYQVTVTINARDFQLVTL